MPLAIELLAARLQSADADYIVSQLDSLPALLDADGPGRHLSISAALGASFAALDPATGRACSQLAAIPAGSTLDTATVCVEASVDTDVAAIVETLVQASIVSLRSGRYQMLEPVRQTPCSSSQRRPTRHVAGLRHVHGPVRRPRHGRTHQRPATLVADAAQRRAATSTRHSMSPSRNQ